MGQWEISPHPLGGEGLVQGTPCAVGVHSSEGWVSWEDPDWIPPNLSIPMVASWLGLGPVLGWNSYSKAWAPSISPSQNKAHFNPFFLHAPDKAMPTGWTQHHNHPWAPPAQVGYPWQGRENARALHVCCFHVRWFPRKPLALHVCHLTPYLLSFG